MCGPGVVGPSSDDVVDQSAGDPSLGGVSDGVNHDDDVPVGVGSRGECDETRRNERTKPWGEEGGEGKPASDDDINSMQDPDRRRSQDPNTE